MKAFQEPVIELVKFEAMDVITSSTVDEGNVGGNGTDIG